MYIEIDEFIQSYWIKWKLVELRNEKMQNLGAIFSLKIGIFSRGI